MTSFTFSRMDFGEDGTPPCLIKNFYAGDMRGSFMKCFEKGVFQDNGIPFQISEVFVSVSAKHVIRGMHFQLHEPQAKLVSVLHGRAYDVLVDLRPNSRTFKKWQAVELSGENHRALYVPRGFAHGFASLENGTMMMYQCEGAYDKASDTGIRFDDPNIGIEWPIGPDEAIHSQRDLSLMSLSEYMQDPMRV